jgi:hypothetical protein
MTTAMTPCSAACDECANAVEIFNHAAAVYAEAKAILDQSIAMNRAAMLSEMTPGAPN